MNLVKKILLPISVYLGALKGKQTVAIDFGSGQTQILFRGLKNVFSTATCVAHHQYYDQVVAFGGKADALYGKTNNQLHVVYPFVDNKILNQSLLESFLDQVFASINLGGFSAKVIIGKPWGMLLTHQKILADILKKKFGGKIEFVDRSFAVYFYLAGKKQIGADACVLLIDDGITQMSLFSQGKIISTTGFYFGINHFVVAIGEILKQKYHLQVSKKTAKKILSQIGIVFFGKSLDNFKMTIRGKDLISSLPSVIQVESKDFEKTFLEISDQLIDKIVDFFSETNPDLLTLILDQGIIMISKDYPKGIDQLIEEKCKCKVLTFNFSLDAVIKGLYLYGQDQ